MVRGVSSKNVYAKSLLMHSDASNNVCLKTITTKQTNQPTNQLTKNTTQQKTLLFTSCLLLHPARCPTCGPSMAMDMAQERLAGRGQVSTMMLHHSWWLLLAGQVVGELWFCTQLVHCRGQETGSGLGSPIYWSLCIGTGKFYGRKITKRKITCHLVMLENSLAPLGISQ